MTRPPAKGRQRRVALDAKNGYMVLFMKKAVSISLGSPSRDKAVEITLLGKKIRLERIGTNGDEAKARDLYRTLDGTVDAFGVGGIDLYVYTPWKKYPLYSAHRMVQDVRITPYVDGSTLRNVLETRVVRFMEGRIGSRLPSKKVFLIEAISRWSMASAFLDAGYDCVFGDLMSALKIPIPIRRVGTLNVLARILLPIVGRLPFSFIYSIGESQDEVVPKYQKYYREASVIAGDWLYIKKHMPEDMEGKVIVTNTTTSADVEFMRQRGIRYLVTSTPVFEGRSFGTNATEAALTAAAGKGRPLTPGEMEKLVNELKFESALQEL
jgi:hypothetical protein